MAVRLTGWLLMAVSLSGCTTMEMNPDYAGPKPLPQAILDDFAYTRPRVLATENQHVMSTPCFSIERVRFPSAVKLIDEESHEVVLDCYRPHGHTKRAAILVLPILGGDYEAARYFAMWFATNGLTSVIVYKHEEHHDPESLESINAVFKQLVLDHRQALDWMESEPGIDMDRVGVFGISAGAIKGSLVFAVDKRVKAAVLALGGGDVPYILSYSDDRRVKRNRLKALEAQGLSQEELHEYLTATFRYDPLDFAPYIDARRVFMILAKNDKVVFYDKGLALREAMGGPHTVVLPSGHYSAVAFTPFIQARAGSGYDTKTLPRHVYSIGVERI